MSLATTQEAQCGRCGKPAHMSLAAEHEGAYLHGGGFRAGLYVCPGCGAPSLAVSQLYRGEWRPPSFLPGPHLAPWTDLPDDIGEEHAEAWNCFHAEFYRASMLMARAAVQHACRYSQAEGRSLKEELEDLVAKGKIVAQLRDAADEVRLLGNDVAHPGEPVTVDREEAEELLGYLDVFLTALIVLPSKLLRRAFMKTPMA